MAEQEDLPFWRPGEVAPDQEQEIDAQYRAYARARDGVPTTVTPAPDVTGMVPVQDLSGRVESGQRPVRSRSRRIFGWGILSLATVAALVGLGYWLAQRADTSNQVASPAPEAASPDDGALDEEPADGVTADTEGAADDSTGDAEDATAVLDTTGDDGQVDDGQADDGQADDGPADESAVPPGNPPRWAVLSDGKLYLRGKVPSAAIGDIVVGKAIAVVGPNNVVPEFEIDESAVIGPNDSGPLFVEDVVLFEFNSTEVAQPFFPLLDLGALLLAQNPQATITVITHTDSTGTEEVNLEVARLRAHAILHYMTSKGINPDQIISDPRGEANAIETDDETVAQGHRRAEFVIAGLLD